MACARTFGLCAKTLRVKDSKTPELGDYVADSCALLSLCARTSGHSRVRPAHMEAVLGMMEEPTLPSSERLFKRLACFDQSRHSQARPGGASLPQPRSQVCLEHECGSTWRPGNAATIGTQARTWAAAARCCCTARSASSTDCACTASDASLASSFSASTAACHGHAHRCVCVLP